MQRSNPTDRRMPDRIALALMLAPLLEEIRQRAGARQARTALPRDASPAVADASRLVVEIESTGLIAGAHCG